MVVSYLPQVQANDPQDNKHMNIFAGLFLDEGTLEGIKDHQMCLNDPGETTLHMLIVAVGWFTPCLPQKQIQYMYMYK